MSPIARSALVMRHGYYLNHIILHAVHQTERETREYIASGICGGPRPSFRRLGNNFNGMAKFGGKRPGCDKAALRIPPLRCLRLFKRLGMKSQGVLRGIQIGQESGLYLLPRHGGRCSGIKLRDTAFDLGHPRRFDPSSTSMSRLSMSKLASAARSLSSRCSALFENLFTGQ